MRIDIAGKSITFGSIRPGETCLLDGNLYMRTSACISIDGEPAAQAVLLSNGYLTPIFLRVAITPISTKVVLDE